MAKKYKYQHVSETDLQIFDLLGKTSRQYKDFLRISRINQLQLDTIQQEYVPDHNPDTPTDWNINFKTPTDWNIVLDTPMGWNINRE